MDLPQLPLLRNLPYRRGHGTGNDFVILDQQPAELLTQAAVSKLCHRRFGIGGDGLLHVETLGRMRGSIAGYPEYAELPDDTWFMDYRNADGTAAEMCGNGVRVFAHYLVAHGFQEQSTFPIATRGGLKIATVTLGDRPDHAQVSVDMGVPVITGRSSCSFGDHIFDGTIVDAGNPHLVCVVESLTAAQLDGMDLSAQPQLDPQDFPEGANIEIVTALDDSQGGPSISMRVIERGVGETFSCGTGIVATALQALTDSEHNDVTVNVRGGDVHVAIDPQTSVATMTGPSELLMKGTFGYL